MDISLINILGASIFALAILHTFSTKFFEHLAHTNPRFEGIFHLLGEVEVVFGFWAMILILFMFVIQGESTAVEYLDTRNYTEPMFVFVIMVIAATRPILQLSQNFVLGLAKLIPIKKEIAIFFLLLSFVPLTGFFYNRTGSHDFSCTFIRKELF